MSSFTLLFSEYSERQINTDRTQDQHVRFSVESKKGQKKRKKKRRTQWALVDFLDPERQLQEMSYHVWKQKHQNRTRRKSRGGNNLPEMPTTDKSVKTIQKLPHRVFFFC